MPTLSSRTKRPKRTLPKINQMLRVNWRTLAVFVLACATVGCVRPPRYVAGDCIQNTRDGYVWRITEVQPKAYAAQGWQNGKWGIVVSAPIETFGSDYLKISCPFSTDTLPEKK